MAKRIRDHKIHLKNERAKLEPRREPYWRHLDTGKHIGYRKTPGSETWIARWTDEDHRFRYQRIGPLSTHDWKRAKEIAETWFDSCEAGVIRPGTVEEACHDYVANRRVEVSEANARDAEKRFRAHLYGTAFGRTKLDKLRYRGVESWRNAVLAKSTPESCKRTFKTLRAALNLAYRRGEISTDAAWKRVPLTVRKEGHKEARNELDFYWTVAERRAWLDACPADLRNLLTAISHTGARPQEIASALVEDFDARARALVLRHRKGHQSREKSRVFTLDNDAAFAFFRRMAKDKTPKAPLLSRADGSSWYTRAHNPGWIMPITRLRKRHGLDPRVTAYHLRHWTLTDWLNQGIVAANVATMAGTSINMLDRYYKKFVHSQVNEKLKQIETV